MWIGVDDAVACLQAQGLSPDHESHRRLRHMQPAPRQPESGLKTSRSDLNSGQKRVITYLKG